MGIDPAWGSSAFGIVITHLVDGVIQVLYAEEFIRPDYNEILHTVFGLIAKYNNHEISDGSVGAFFSLIGNTLSPKLVRHQSRSNQMPQTLLHHWK